MMREVELQANGEFVAVVEVLPFPNVGMPEVVVWGARCFKYLAAASEKGRPIYKEVFAFMSLTPSPGLPA